MENWDEVRTAYQVARLGTVSGAADVLGVHHATVIRHIDALEAQLGVKLFQRHARGYTATEAGQDLMRVAQATDDQFGQLEGRIKGRGAEVSGELVITSLGGFADLITPILADFQVAHPDLLVRFLTDDRVFRLEYGEAHVAIRAGNHPEMQDNVAQELVDLKMGLFASKEYVERHGAPETEQDLVHHRFVGHDNENSRAPFYVWLKDRVPRENVVFRTTSDRAVVAAIRGGVGLGFTALNAAGAFPELQMVLPPRPEWSSRIRLVTHVDLHRTAKVQAFLKFLKERAREWPGT
ncbi:LysR family transcriptional regulator [Thiosulfatihalobacter marinus]|jgi:DNA-binding transcriptional LysR family regulator|uniref:LysR family transcriptional regulator n=1 Tax=Thiosulfatihalobacter marinus TaxID=2792481 RepID=UPI0018D7D026|nr:LysR family transcriptional regulator [Thiosulfatihalobacter marinus]